MTLQEARELPLGLYRFTWKGNAGRTSLAVVGQMQSGARWYATPDAVGSRNGYGIPVTDNADAWETVAKVELIELAVGDDVDYEGIAEAVLNAMQTEESAPVERVARIEHEGLGVSIDRGSVRYREYSKAVDGHYTVTTLGVTTLPIPVDAPKEQIQDAISGTPVNALAIAAGLVQSIRDHNVPLRVPLPPGMHVDRSRVKYQGSTAISGTYEIQNGGFSVEVLHVSDPPDVCAEAIRRLLSRSPVT